MTTVRSGSYKSVSGTGTASNPNIYTSLRIEYSGTTAHGYLDIYRDAGNYTGYYVSSGMNIGKSWGDAVYNVGIGSNSFYMDQTWRQYYDLGSFTIDPSTAKTVNAWVNTGKTGVSYTRWKFEGSVTIPAQYTQPSWVSDSTYEPNVYARTYNTISAQAKIESIGTGPGYSEATGSCENYWSGTTYKLRVVLAIMESSATEWNSNRMETVLYRNDTGLVQCTSSTPTSGWWINAAGTCQSHTKLFNIAGCGTYKWALWLANGHGRGGVTTNLRSATLPPAPLSALTVSTAVSGTTVTATVKITGGAEDGTNNISGAKVTTQYRVYNGSSWGSWTTAASNHSPATAQTVTVTGLPGSTSCQVQARQLTYSDTNQISEVKTTSFTTPSTYHLTYNGSEVTSCTYNGSEVTTITLNGTTVWQK